MKIEMEIIEEKEIETRKKEKLNKKVKKIIIKKH